MTLPEALLLGLWCHFLGDYLLQSDWMAVEKTKKWLPAAVHAVTYTSPFLTATIHITINSLALWWALGGVA